MNLKTHNK